MNTNNAGSPEQGSRWLVIIFRLGLVIALLCGVLVGPGAISVLYGLVAPPDMPLLPDAREVSHESVVYGVDAWEYRTAQNACEVITFYREAGGVCELEGDWCAGKQDTIVYQDPVGVCTGSETFSIFPMRWRAEIRAGYHGVDGTGFSLSRTIFWSGEAPLEVVNP